MQSLFEERQQRLQKKLRLLYEQYDVESRVEEKIRLEAVIKTTQNELQALSSNSIQRHAPTKIYSNRLPTVKGEFFGRTTELDMLNNAWKANSTTNIIQFIAPGGTGKTKLLRHWLNHTDDIDMLLAWSFYSQGFSEEKQTSATPFFTHAFAKLGATRTEFATEEDRGDYLADLLLGRRCMLVLDGLEPFQYANTSLRGALKDRAIRQLLKNIAGYNQGLCIITTRIAVYELTDQTHVISHNLQNLAPMDGVRLLKSLGVKGTNWALKKAVKEYGYHALALSLLGNVLRLRYQGNVCKRDMLKALPVNAKGNHTSRHAFKVMQAYKDWFTGEPELSLLYLLGLFDHPIEQEVLQVLWNAQIPCLTSGIDEDAWLEAIEGLREEYHLLSQHESKCNLDSHPLIREYFGKRLQEHQPDAWQQAHHILYEYYKNLPNKKHPVTLEEMQPLFRAVAHGCAAGLHAQVWKELYWARIKRGETHYIEYKLGAFSDNLATLSHFFRKPWSTPSSNLNADKQALILNISGFSLRALGRLHEALEPTSAAVEKYVQQENWHQAALNASNHSELQLTLGNIAAAAQSGKDSVDYAIQAGDIFHHMARLITHADALHQAGNINAALALFQKAEKLQKKRTPENPRLYSLAGFRYCDLLLAQNRIAEVLERAHYALHVYGKPIKKGFGLHDIALDQLTIGQAHTQQKEFSQAIYWLNQAVTHLRQAGRQDYLPSSLLACATLYRHISDFAHARETLQELFALATSSGMRLYLTDYHLEMARLLLAENNENAQIPTHIAAAAQLINDTGYHRRDTELAALQQLVTH